ncbi:MAG: sensor histidine kinase [Spirochaetales bacterium]|nr:sensor histidine kinase [Spirochaetales bacterium]
MFRLPRRFLTKVFLSLLLTGMIQVLLLGIVAVLFSNRMIEETYSQHSHERMEMLLNRVNLTIQSYRESATQLAKKPILTKALNSSSPLNREELSTLYSTCYRELGSGIDEAAIHLINLQGEQLYSTHMLPSRYNPNGADPSLGTFLKLKPQRETFPMVDGFTNPKGNEVALSLFQFLESEGFNKSLIIYDLTCDLFTKLLKPINAGFFSNLYLFDTINYKFVRLDGSNEWGNFSEIDWRVPITGEGVIQHEETLVAYAQSYPDELMLVGTLKLDTVAGNVQALIRFIFVISLIGLILSSILAFLLARAISHPVTILSQGMKEMESGNLNVRMEETNGDEFDILIHGFNDMAHRIQELLDARVLREKALRKAERHALQSQINPHFLYNTLNTVNSLSKIHGIQDITTIITQLGKLLRNAMDQQSEVGTVENALALVEGYLEIQKIRFGENFQWSIHLDEAIKNFPLPRLIIQPIVENAVIHGLEPLVGKRQLEIEGLNDPPRLLVRDNGKGMDGDCWEKALNNTEGIGIHNVNKRLHLYYGEDAGLFFQHENEYTTIEIRLGWQLKEDVNEA